MQEATAGVDPDVLYTAQELRMYHTAIGTLNGQGVYKGTHFQVTQRALGANFSVDVAAGIAGVVGDDVTNQGIYYCWNDAVANVVTPSAPASGTRIHRLVVQVRDKLHNGTYTTYDFILSLLADVGSGTPAEPNSAVTLALITITSASLSVQNAQIADQRVVWSDQWNSLTGLQSNGWSMTGNDLPVSGYRLRPGDPTIMEYMALYATGTMANDTIVTTLPVPYRVSANFQHIACATKGGTAGNNTPRLQFGTDGNVRIENCDSSVTNLYVNGSVRLL